MTDQQYNTLQHKLTEIEQNQAEILMMLERVEEKLKKEDKK